MEQKPDAEREVRQCLKTLRIIVFSLAMGLLIFTGVVITSQAPAAPGNPAQWMYMAVFAGMALLARLLVPGIVFIAIRRKIAQGTWPPNAKGCQSPPQTDEGLLMAAQQTKTIVACALLEGAGFANVVAYMSERHVVSLAITLAMILMILAHFPLRFWLDGWLERQKRWLDEDRSMRPSEHGAAS